MSKNPSDKREVILLEDFPRSGTPEPAPKRQRTSRSSSTRPGQDSSRSEESRAGATRRSKVSKAGATGSEETSSAGPVRPLAAALSSDQPELVAMAHLSITRSSRDPADRKTSGEADAAARPAMVAVITPDPSGRKTSGEADAEARPAMSAITSKDPSDRKSHRG